MATQELNQFSDHTAIAATFLVGQNVDNSGGKMPISEVMALPRSSDIDMATYEINTTTVNGSLTFDANGTGGFVFGSGHTTPTGTKTLIIGLNHIDVDANYSAVFGQDNSRATPLDSIGNYSLIAGQSNYNNSGTHCSISGYYNHSNSGNYCSISGSNNYSNSGNYCILSGWAQGSNSGHYCLVAGSSHDSNSGDYCTLLGWGNSNNSGNYTLISGSGNTGNSGSGCLIIGNACSNSGNYAVITGLKAANTLYGAHAHASGWFAANGDAQRRTLVVRKATIDDTADVELFLTGSSGQMIIPVNTAWNFECRIVAAEQGMANIKRFNRSGLIVNDGGSTTIATEDIIGSDLEIGSPGAWSVDIDADDTNDALIIQVTGTITNIRWVATVELVEVSYP